MVEREAIPKVVLCLLPMLWYKYTPTYISPPTHSATKWVMVVSQNIQCVEADG